MTEPFCVSCGQRLGEDHVFCPKCGMHVAQSAKTGQTPATQGTQTVQQTSSSRGWGMGRIAIAALLIILILVVPVFPRDRVVYADGSTQTVTMSTSYETSVQAFPTQTQMQVSVYQGTLKYVPDQYYSQYNQNYYGYSPYYSNNYYYNSYPYYYSYYPSYYNASSPSCHYDSYGNYYCSYSYSYWYDYPYYYNYYPYSYYNYYPYGYYNYYPYSYSYPYNSYSYSNYANTVTVNPSDQVVQVQQSQESNGLYTVTLTHYDGTSQTYKHVVDQSLTKSGIFAVQGTATVTKTITNSVLNPVTTTVPCQHCIEQHVTQYVSLLQLIFGY